MDGEASTNDQYDQASQDSDGEYLISTQGGKKAYGGYYSGGCSTCGVKKIKIRRRVCNATMDENFDAQMFLKNSSYYGDCDCVVFKNCTNETIVIPPEIVVPPVPSGGSECNYTCDDIRALHIVITNLTNMVLAQQDDIDMLIGQVQDLKNSSVAPSGDASGNCSCSYFQEHISGLHDDVDALYSAVNNVTASSANATIAQIRDNGLRFGDNWWFGSQGDYLFAIDVADSTYYRFDTGVNKTL